MSKQLRVPLKVLDLLIIFMMVFSAPVGVLAAPSPTGATITSDLADYNPGGTVTLTGAGWASEEVVHIVVNDTIGQTWQHVADVTANTSGSFTDVFNLPNYFVSDYDVTATGPTSKSATTTFTDANPSADLDQCANDPAPSPNTDGCNTNANEWVNGNVGGSKALYFEGDSLPYRMKFDNLTLASHTVIIKWDTTKSSTHALDYLTTFNRTVANANPCLGVSGCNPNSFTTFPIPADPQVTGAGVTPVAGNFTFYGATITSVSAYSYPDGPGFTGDKSAQISITFTPTVINPVLAWAAHISTRADWGANNSAVAISGSPYHTALVNLDGSGGSQDRSLSADAVIFPGSITIVKDATPNGSTSFSFTASPAPLSNFSLVDDGTSANTKTFSNITAFQSYTVNETPIPANWGFDSVSCSVTTPNGGSYTTSSTTVNISMEEGENWICTYLDSQRTGSLTVIKHVVNDNGGTATAGQWSIHVKSGSSEVSGSPQAGSESGTSYLTLNAGTYNVSETGGPSGYTFTGFSGDCDSSGNVTVVVGQSKTCTLTNNDQAAHLKLVKTVTNDNGGTAAAADFTLSASGPTPISGAGGAESDVNAGSYNLSETNLPGYTAGSWSCVGGSQNGASITLANGESATCTINNNDNSAHLTLVKVVVNDNGGTAAAADWTLSANGPTPISGAGGVSSDVSAGSYSLSESSGPAGYSTTGYDCGASVSLALGESKTCTITNDDIAPKLHLRKVVVNDNGGTATVANFTLTADGTGSNDLSGTSPVDSGAGLKADTWALSELSANGYASGLWECSGGTQNGSNITLGIGGEATCTITNDDQAARLTLVKTVTNDNGGMAAVTDFTLSAAGPTPISGAGGVDSNVNAGTYTLSETSLPGYAAGSWSCVGGTFTAPDKIALANGQHATCTINNDDQTAHLKLVKTVTNDNGGTAVATDFTLSAAGPTPLSGAGGAESDVNAGSYNLSETNVTGYTAGSWSCVGGTQNGASVSLALGQSATCTINNNDNSAHLKLVKTVTNDNGGTAVATDFTLSAAGPTPLSGAGGAESNVNAGSYNLSETNVAGYTAGSWSCVGGTQNGASVSLALGQSATCTINNNDIAPKLHLRKVVVNNNGGTKTVADFTLTANGTGTNDLSGTSPVDSTGTLKADTWALSETSVYGYTASAWVCSGGTQSGSNITVGIGGEATCTITNDDKPGTIVVQKIIKPVGALTSFTFNTTGTGYNGFALAGGQTNTQNLNAGSYTVKELVPLGWVLTGIGGSTDPNTPYNCTVTGSGGSTGVGDLNTQTASISLKNGDTVTCVFENTGQGVTRTQGFWATHPQLAQIAWFGGTAFGHTFPGVANTAGIGDMTLCGRNIDTLGKVMGAFWSDVSKTSTGAKRSALDQARMQLLQQLIAAELNASAFGSVPSSGSFAAWESAYCGTNQNNIKNAQQQSASFNTNGDSGTFTPGTSADSKAARAGANYTFWDILP